MQKPLALNVDDSDAQRYIRTKILNKAGFEVIEAAFGKEALRLAAERRPNLIVLDVKLPDVDGREVCRTLKNDPTTASVPVIQTSAYFRSAEDAVASLEYADAYLRQPCSPEELIATVHSTMRARESERKRIGFESERLQAALLASGTGTYRVDLHADLVEPDENLERLFGLRPTGSPRRLQDFMSAVHPDDRNAFTAATDRAAQEGTEIDIEYRVIHPDGSVHWLMDKGRAHPDEKGKPGFVAGACVDITERKQTDYRLRELAAIVESSDDAIIGKKLDGTIKSWNRAAERLYGYRQSEAVGKHISLIAAPEADDFPEIMRQVAAGEPIHRREVKRRRKDGTIIDVQLTVSPIRNGSGKIVGASTVARDITDRKREQEALRDSEARFRATFEQAAVGMVLVDLEGHWFRINDRYCEIVGYSRDELLGRQFAEITHPEDRFISVAEFNRILKGKIKTLSLEKRYVRKDRSTVWVNVTLSLVRDESGTPLYFIVVAEDINDRKRVQEALRASEEKFRATFEGAGVGIGRVSFADACWIDANEALCRMVGYTAEEMRVTPWPKITHPDDIDIDLVPFRRMAAGEIDGYVVEKRFIHKEGQVVWARLTLSMVHDLQGQPDYEIAVVENITDRKLAQQALLESEERFRDLSELVPQLIWTADAEGRITYVNQRWCSYTGQVPAEAVGLGSMAAVHPDDAADTTARWDEALRTGNPLELEFRLRSRDGQYRWFVSQALPVRDDHGQIRQWFGSCTDIDDMKRAQEALIRSEKLASVGRMAATVAHEINNPLEVIMNSVYLASVDKQLPASARTNLEIAEQELQRVAHLTRQTLGFYRENAQPAQVDLATLVKEVVELYSPKIRQRGLTLQAEYGSDLQVHAVAGEIRQVVSNLVANAIDASESGGRIRIRTSCSPVHGSRFARLTIADTGSGIERENLKHIFEPFFTTKESVGTGLGLWITREIIRRHGGKVRVRGREGCGAVFSVLLPEIAHPNEECSIEGENGVETAHIDRG